MYTRDVCVLIMYTSYLKYWKYLTVLIFKSDI